MQRVLQGAFVLALAVAPAASGQEGQGMPTPDADATDAPLPAPPGPGLDRLLRVPSSTPLDVEVDRRGGKGRAEWQAEFEALRSEIGELEARIEKTQARLREQAGDDWGFSPTGAAGPPVDPEMLKLRAQLKRDRESLESAQERARDLEVEASLAGVPESWRRAREAQRGDGAGDAAGRE